MDLEIKVREDELIQKFVDEKQKIRLLDEKERSEHDEKIPQEKKKREIEAREIEIEIQS